MNVHRIFITTSCVATIGLGSLGSPAALGSGEAASAAASPGAAAKKCKKLKNPQARKACVKRAKRR